MGESSHRRRENEIRTYSNAKPFKRGNRERIKGKNYIKSNKANIKNISKARNQNERQKTIEKQRTEWLKFGDSPLKKSNKEATSCVPNIKRVISPKKNNLICEKDGEYDQVTHPEAIKHIKKLYSNVTKPKKHRKKHQIYPGQANLKGYLEKELKRRAIHKPKGSQTDQEKACLRLYEEHKDRQIRMQQRKKEKEKKEKKERNPWERTKSRTRSRMRKERQIKEEEAKFKDKIVKIDKEEQNLRKENEKIQKDSQERIKRSNFKIEGFKKESSNVGINRRELSQKDKLENFKRVENNIKIKLRSTDSQRSNNTKISIMPKTKTTDPTLINHNPNLHP
ncbi:unnamed protein product [Moneuplotes crassus]|uniref:Uncharacterized protein n=1 Tax=Euplotes crassus TaxID=5936 RepID=A0AAD1XVY8_EUPCR|nr:unnamed protein product [Moneuplotes crassus]